MKKIDLHCHTSASDGLKTPSELIDFAIKNGISVLAITDHDTVSGLEEAVSYSEDRDITLVTGIEFSIDYHDGSFHLVGLGIDHRDREISSVSAHLQEVRDNRIYRIIEDLSRNGIHIPVEDVIEESGGGVMGRPHVARTLVKHGYAVNTNDVFQKFLVKGKPGYVGKERVSLHDAVRLVKNAGGIPVIAHPSSINYNGISEFEAKLKGFVDSGVEGIEVYASFNKPAEIGELRRLAVKYKLVISGGSDYHGDKNEVIGYYQPGEAIPYDEVYESLHSKMQDIPDKKC